jgi:murein DD-endopeptidase MepM/ murein hydrolase activator NlpD
MPSLLGRAGIPAPAADGIIASLRLAGFNMRAMKPGDSLAVCFRDSTPLRLHYAQSYDRVWQVDVDAGACRVSMLLREVTARLELVRGAITSSLYQALVDMGERPALIADYTDVFSWEIDFFSEPQPGDSFVILVEKRYADPGFIGYGAILAARYRGQVGDLAGFRFTDPDGHTDYYNRDGQSLRKTFLKSPLRFSRISSRFGNRRHPILRARRMHHGIDYVAPTGTPVSCVADGRVTAAGWSGGYGRLVEVSHPEGYTTRYGHLSRFHRGIRRGAAVTQGQTIGYVGSSGMSTGPHLHYEVRKFGSSVNPLRLNPPRAAPVKLAFVAPFQAVRDSLSSLLAAPVPSPPPR